MLVSKEVRLADEVVVLMRSLKHDTFRAFTDLTMTHFAFLLTDYGFRHVSTRTVAYDCAVVFENDTTRVTVSYEIGSLPWVAIGQIEQRDGRAEVRNETSLEHVLSHKGVADIEGPVEADDIPDEKLDEVLRFKASKLRDDANDLLRGSFESLPALMNAAEEDAKKRNLELFGTERGETP